MQPPPGLVLVSALSTYFLERCRLNATDRCRILGHLLLKNGVENNFTGSVVVRLLRLQQFQPDWSCFRGTGHGYANGILFFVLVVTVDSEDNWSRTNLHPYTCIYFSFILASYSSSLRNIKSTNSAVLSVYYHRQVNLSSSYLICDRV